MGKKTKAEKKVETQPEMIDPFVGSEDDDLMDMEYIQDEDSTTKVETQPPETKEEAEAIAEQEEDDGETKAKDEADVDDTKVKDEESESTSEEEPKKDDETAIDEDKGKTEKVDDDPKIPKDRFDEVNDRMKTAEKERDELREQLESVVEDKQVEPDPEPYDYKTKEAEAMEAMLEGDSEKYSAINAEIREAEKADLVREAKKVAEQGDQNLQDSLTFDEAGARIESDFPEFSPTNESFNEKAHEELLDLYVGYAQSGKYTRVQALQRAAKQAARNFDIKPVSEATAEDADDKPDNVVDIKPVDVEAKAKVDNAQPPAMESAAEGEHEEPRRDFAKMSDEEFDALPESTKRRARGDVFTG